ncbi:hypothetical protein [Mahella australiensis]|uniref:Uncharacterized protein n=1 Tax=Mahella australiensis (strain DSM 15567 / CIP 107919 / 50-1 BON) TaxID=697281 RepID=F3ZZY4_MAHA5|nr:hypothetical protein [Mahella australiensis]AEE95802.1 hypothetical protein Mahau_0599 [Mahella australiensis 50-1 BON]
MADEQRKPLVDMSKEGEVVQMLADVWRRYVDYFVASKRYDAFLYHIQKCQQILFDEMADKESPYHK